METVPGTDSPKPVYWTTPHGIVEKGYIISAMVDVKPFGTSDNSYLKNIGLMAQADYIIHQNKNNVVDNNTSDLQVTIGVNWAL